MTSTVVSGLVHLSMLVTYLLTNYYTFFILDIPLRQTFRNFDPGQVKYLTVWNLIIQAVFFFICLLNDFYGSNKVNLKKRPLIRKIKDYIHATFSFPIAMFVGITFWALMFVDRELVLPKALDPYFPWWLNHMMHTMIMVTTLLETIICPRQYPKRGNGLAGLSVLMLAYLVWMHVIHAKSGIWVYPVMEVLTFPLRVAFFAVLFVFVTILYFAGESLDNLIWGNAQLKQHKSYSKIK
ncbi:androgen-dependent TFPI-regulating protein isoform X2 [Orussus abietinus]|uniref:androgen-dependent TFPI-regulating protein isoform X2 n=1 Tax=Orussus abietinus TaxID=222816 RepID=UPI000626A1DA|nr:androgen-dependent TFPI-regulating protein isoform X2 [Orussus abietinus]XP_012278972.1 androgen-dependent TFPI-regulating protein isoform X2 [Orussus abietinus]